MNLASENPPTAFERILQAFTECMQAVAQSRTVRRIAEGEVSVAHYRSLMAQISHQARENPQIQALATVRFRGRQRALVSSFYRHALSEIGHDQMALDDYEAAGGTDVRLIPLQNPLPATVALVAFAFYQIRDRNPVGYLGYLFFLEFLPTQQGRAYRAMFERIGVPANAFSFIDEHAAVDVGHNRAMQAYIDQLVVTADDLQSVINAVRTTAYLYERMVESAFDWVDNPYDIGTCADEMLPSAKSELPAVGEMS